MNVCRTCLKTPANRNILELENDINDGKKNYLYIMLFCLDIKVIEDSDITTNLCYTCYNKIVCFYKFKELSQKNDLYLKSLDIESLKENEVVVPVKEDDIKNEDCSDSDDYNLNTEEIFEVDVKKEPAVKEEDALGDIQSDDELLSVIKKEKYENEANIDNANDETKENVQNIKKRGRPKKIKPLNVGNDKVNKLQVCEECGKSVRNLKEHSLRHQPKAERRKYQCKLCDKEFNSATARRKHIRIKHLGIKKKCDICNKEVVSLRQHNLVVHNTSQLPFGCVSCGRRFISHSNLLMHMTVHTKDRPFECDVCQKKFRANYHLQLHKRQVHDREKSHLCQFCSKTFFKRYHLQVHLRSHTKEKPYECPDCGKFFSSTSVLKNHRLIHSGLKPHQCQHCDMTFTKPSYLKNHMISHTKERRYSCQFCSVRFGRSDHRKRHEWTAHQKHLAAT